MTARQSAEFEEARDGCCSSMPDRSRGRPAAGDDAPSLVKRRSFLEATIAAGSLTLPVAAPLSAWAEDTGDEQKNSRPKEGDLFVFSSGEKQGQVVTPAEIVAGSGPVIVWPMDPASKTVRDGSRLNQALLVRLDPASLDEVTASHAADGIVAYSAICTHQQCPVSGWNAEKQVVHCQCHQSDFDPRQSGKRVFGPAPRPLPALPVKISDGALNAAGTFIGRVGSSSG